MWPLTGFRNQPGKRRKRDENAKHRKAEIGKYLNKYKLTFCCFFKCKKHHDKMKTLKNIKLGALALVLGLGLVFTQSAFTPAVLNTYHFDGTDWQLVTRSYDDTIDMGTGQYDPNSYQCVGDENICTAQIESEESTVPGSQNPDLFNQTDGIYTENP